MKNSLSVIFAAALILACNSAKEKTATTGNNGTPDTAKTNDIISSDSGQQVSAAVDTTPVSASRLVIPGKSIGLTAIDEKNADALKNLGEPASQDAGMGKELATWYSKPVIHGTDTVINETNIFFTTNMGGPDEASRVRHIRITSGFFMTARHIGTGSVMDSVQKYFPGIKKIATYSSLKTKKQVTIYDDSHSGIAFEMDEGQKCVGITVHKPGEAAFETYNALFADVKFF